MGTLISKSKYLAGLQCPKLLWTHYNEKAAFPEIAPATQAVFDVGHEIGRLAQRLWPDGVEVPHCLTDLSATADRTRALMQERVPVFEASFLVNGRYCRVDILEPTDDGGWNLIEVKSSTKVKPINLEDVAFQADTLERAGVALRRLNLMHVDTRYVRRGEIDPAGLLTTEDVTDDCRALQGSVAQRVEAMLAVISGARPDVPIGPQCRDPFECPIEPVCWAWLPQHSVATLYRARKSRVFSWLGQGLTRLVDVPDNDLSPAQLIQKTAVLSGEPYVNPPGIRAWLDRLKYPLYLLDFETINPAIPLYEGTRPYERIPFQFSLHVLAAPGEDPAHFEFLAETPEDPRSALLAALRRIGPQGTVLAYSMSFEASVLGDLSAAFPASAEMCDDLVIRMDDLIRPFSGFDYYHPNQRGSCSIKAVLPAITGRGYENLDIRDGNTASRTFISAVIGTSSPETRHRLLTGLLQYCFRDTHAMVQLLAVLESQS